MSKIKMTPSEVIENRMNTLTGEILTIIEAVVPPVEQDLVYYNGSLSMVSSTSQNSRQNTQREAIKGLIKTAFSRAQNDMQDWIK